jgi:hypothetical protein
LGLKMVRAQVHAFRPDNTRQVFHMSEEPEERAPGIKVPTNLSRTRIMERSFGRYRKERVAKP